MNNAQAKKEGAIFGWVTGIVFAALFVLIVAKFILPATPDEAERKQTLRLTYEGIRLPEKFIRVEKVQGVSVASDLDEIRDPGYFLEFTREGFEFKITISSGGGWMSEHYCLVDYYASNDSWRRAYHTSGIYFVTNPGIPMKFFTNIGFEYRNGILAGNYQFGYDLMVVDYLIMLILSLIAGGFSAFVILKVYRWNLCRVRNA